MRVPRNLLNSQLMLEDIPHKRIFSPDVENVIGRVRFALSLSGKVDIAIALVSVKGEQE